MLDGIQPITNTERAARIEKARSLMREQNLGAIYIENGTSIFYFTGKRQVGKAWILPRKGEPAWIDAGCKTPFGKGLLNELADVALPSVDARYVVVCANPGEYWLSKPK